MVGQAVGAVGIGVGGIGVGTNTDGTLVGAGVVCDGFTVGQNEGNPVGLPVGGYVNILPPPHAQHASIGDIPFDL
jgi:hypothetical protein